MHHLTISRSLIARRSRSTLVCAPRVASKRESTALSPEFVLFRRSSRKSNRIVRAKIEKNPNIGKLLSFVNLSFHWLSLLLQRALGWKFSR